jgi:hypothetical protein
MAEKSLLLSGQPDPVVDLTTVAAVKDRMEIQNSSNSDLAIQDAITGFSQLFLSRSGYPSFANLVQATETRDGNGNNEMFVRYPPVRMVSSVSVNGQTVPAAGPWPSAGYYVSDNLRSIKIRGGTSQSRAGYYFNYAGIRSNLSLARGFACGDGNVQLVYVGGFAAVPADLEYAVRCVVAINMKRQAWQDIASRSISAGGGAATTSYRDWSWPPEYEEIFEYYIRKAVIT